MRKGSKKPNGVYELKAYRAWRQMKSRCNNPNSLRSEHYFFKGIKYCEKWEAFGGFYEDMGNPPEGYLLDRIDPDKGYYKENCRWVDIRTSNLNRGKNKNNKSGITGICFENKTGRWAVTLYDNNKRKRAYWGYDFFEACCVRKSWESKQGDVYVGRMHRDAA